MVRAMYVGIGPVSRAMYVGKGSMVRAMYVGIDTNHLFGPTWSLLIFLH